MYVMSVDLSDPLTIYPVLQLQALESHGRLLRMWISVLLTCITREVGRPALHALLLDEAAAVDEARLE